MEDIALKNRKKEIHRMKNEASLLQNAIHAKARTSSFPKRDYELKLPHSSLIAMTLGVPQRILFED